MKSCTYTDSPSVNTLKECLLSRVNFASVDCFLLLLLNRVWASPAGIITISPSTILLVQLLWMNVELFDTWIKTWLVSLSLNFLHGIWCNSVLISGQPFLPNHYLKGDRVLYRCAWYIFIHLGFKHWAGKWWTVVSYYLLWQSMCSKSILEFCYCTLRCDWVHKLYIKPLWVSVNYS